MRGTPVRRRFISLFRVIDSGTRNLFRNAWLTTAAIAVMTVTITVVGSAVIANYALQEAIEVASRDLTISVFLRDEASEQIRQDLEAELVGNQHVDKAYFKSKGEALADFQEANADNQKLLEGIALANGNPLPASYEVFMNDINQYQEILDIASADKYSDLVRETNDNETSRDAFNGFIRTQEGINSAGVILGGVFGAIPILVIFNTIRMAILTRSDEIEIMKLIGATPNYIRGPFLVEAMMYGAIASSISLALIYSFVVPFAKQFLEDESATVAAKFDTIFPDGVVTYFTEQWLTVGLITFAVGVGLGFISSSVAMAKYLRLRRW